MLPIAKRDTKDIHKMIQRQQDIQRLNQNPEISYNEACELYRFYKRKTLKANSEDSDFNQNMEFREFFLSVKKRYDVRFRAQKFRIKKKKEIAQLKEVVQGVNEQSLHDSTSISQLGKRPCPHDRTEDEDQMAIMREKINKLQDQVEQKDRQLQLLIQNKSNNQKQLDQVPQTPANSTRISGQDIQDTASFPIISHIKQRLDTAASRAMSETVTIEHSNQSIPLNTQQKKTESPGIREKQILRINLSPEPKQPPASLVKVAVDMSVVDQTVEQKENELIQCRKDLNKRVREMIEQQMFLVQMKPKPQKLIKRRDELQRQLSMTQQEIQIIEQNFKITSSFIQSEQMNLNFKQNQIFELDKRVKELITDLNRMKQN